MKVLLLGSGGREHAIAQKLSESKDLEKLFIAPGNPGTAQIGENVPITVNNFIAIGNFVLENKINMVIVGPEDPLVNGIKDYFLNNKDLKAISIIGPDKAGAELEGSKDFAKDFMTRHGIPTAAYATFTSKNYDEACSFIDRLKAPYVLKADGLAAGKGVLIINDINEAKKQLKEMFSGMFGSAGNKVVIEEFLKGIEVSMFVLTDGLTYKLLPEAKDYKRIYDNDEGPNTGGMGAVSPVPFADDNFKSKVIKQIIEPTISGLRKDNIDYRGFIFFGLMNCDGQPYVIEYNVRMGDPETEAVMPRIDADILDLFKGVASQDLENRRSEIFEQTAVTVVLVSEGYPANYETGKIIKGISKDKKDIKIYQAGTKQEGDVIVSAGGRVMAITGLGNNIKDAQNKVYKHIKTIDFQGMKFRTDIGKDLL